MDATNMSQKSTAFFIEEVLGCKIITPEGKSIGHVADLQLTPGPEYEVTALFFGSLGWLHRWHIFAPFAELFGLRFPQKTIPWQAVEHIEQRTVRLTADWQQYLDKQKMEQKGLRHCD